MDAQTPSSRLHRYMGKGHSIKVDVVTRQAVVSPIFKKQSVPPISERYVKVFDPVSDNLEAQSDENYFLETKLYDKYKTLFNNISAEAIINLNKPKQESDNESVKSSSTCESHNCKTSSTKRKRAKIKEHKSSSLDYKRSKSDSIYVKPWIPYLPTIVESIYTLSSSKGEHRYKNKKKNKYNNDCNEIRSRSSLGETETIVSDDSDVNSDASSDSYIDADQSKNKISYKYVKNLVYSLLTFVNTIDDWNHRVDEAMCRTGVDRITLNEAKSLLQEFRDSTCGILSSGAADKLESEIARAEEYCVEIRKKLVAIFEDSEENTADLDDVETFLKEGMNTTFMTQEYLTLNQVFYNISSLRHLIVESLIQSDFEVCASLLEKCGEYSVKIPDIDIIRTHVVNSLWLYHAQKYAQKPANYTLVSELLENTPDELKDSRLYKHLSEKLQMTMEWVNKFEDPKFNRILMYDTIKASRYSDKSKGESDSVGNENRKHEAIRYGSTHENVSPGIRDRHYSPGETRARSLRAKIEDRSFVNEPKLTPEELESAYNGYQTLEMTIPTLKNIEPVYTMWRRFKRRLKKLENLLSSGSKVNCIKESLLVLQHAEPVNEYVDTAELLEPLRNDVEVSLNFERKCRNVLNKFNNWTVTSDTIKLKIEWNSLINFKRNTTVNSNDLTDMINIINSYLSRNNGVSDKEELGGLAEMSKSNYSGSFKSKDKAENECENGILEEANADDLVETEDRGSNNDADVSADSNSDEIEADIGISSSNFNSTTTISTVESGTESATNDLDDTMIDDSLNSQGNDSNTGTPLSVTCASSSDNTPTLQSNVFDDYYETTNLNEDEVVKTRSEYKMDTNEGVLTISNNKGNTGSPNEMGNKKIQFSELVELYDEFHELKVKNWQQFRNVEDIYKLGFELREKVGIVIGSIKEGVRTDESVSNLILVSLEVIRYGANMNLEVELLKALKYCLWSKKLYGSLDKLYRLTNRESDYKGLKVTGYGREMVGEDWISEEMLRDYEALFYRLASEPERESFKEYVNGKKTIAHHLNIKPQKGEDYHDDNNSGIDDVTSERNDSNTAESTNIKPGKTEEIGQEEGVNGGSNDCKIDRKDDQFRTLVVSKKILSMTELDVVNELTLQTAQ